MIDHIGFPVSNYERSKAFYTLALAPLGYTLIMEVGPDQTEGGNVAAGFGAGGKPDFWIGSEGGTNRPLHVAIAAKDRAAVDAFYSAALAAGGKDNGAPGLRPHYHPNYYGAFVLDPTDTTSRRSATHRPDRRCAATVCVGWVEAHRDATHLFQTRRIFDGFCFAQPILRPDWVRCALSGPQTQTSS